MQFDFIKEAFSKLKTRYMSIVESDQENYIV